MVTASGSLYHVLLIDFSLQVRIFITCGLCVTKLVTIPVRVTLIKVGNVWRWGGLGCEPFCEPYR